MLRIKGRIGDWPVDLTLELDAEGWSELAARLPLSRDVKAAPEEVPVAGQADALWQTCLQLLQQAGQIEGPVLLAQLAALAGGEAAGKRLLVRLRHCPQVRVEPGEDAPIYHWTGVQ